MRLNAGIWNAAWTTPPINVPTASARIGGLICGASQSAAEMTDRFRSTGVNAGVLKALKVLRMPADRATSEIKKI